MRETIFDTGGHVVLDRVTEAGEEDEIKVVFLTSAITTNSRNLPELENDVHRMVRDLLLIADVIKGLRERSGG